MPDRPRTRAKRPRRVALVAGALTLLPALLAVDAGAQARRAPSPIAIRVGDFIFDGLAAGPEDGDPVILLHGFPETSYAFRHQLEALGAAGYRAVAPDQRGYSPDARPPGVADYAMGPLVGDVAGIADSLGFDTFHLVGHDWGGAVAWVVAASMPQRVRTLTVLSTPHPRAFGSALADPDDDQARRSSYFDVFRADDAEQRFLADDAAFLRQVLAGVEDDAAIDVYVDALGTPEAIGAALNWYRATNVASSASRASPSTGASPATASSNGIGPSPGNLEINVPTLYVFGAEDTAFSAAAARASARYVKGPYRFINVERVGHWLMERAARRVNTLLLDHLSSSSPPFHLAFTEVRPDIWMAYRRDPFRSPVHGNVTIIVNRDDVVVVDAGSSPAAARQIIRKIRSLTSVPVSVLVNTHGHEDHVLGNQVFVEEFPGVEIIARPGTREYLESGRVERRVRDFVRQMSSRQEAGEAEIARVLRRGLNGDEAVAERLRRYWERDIYAVREEYLNVDVTLPTKTFEGRLVLQRGARTIELLDLGFGKAGSDVVVYLPDERLLIAGDVVTHPFPYGFSRLQTKWLETLRRIRRIDFDDLVPGHGEVLVDKAYVDEVIELVEFELSEVRAAIREGRDAASTAWGLRFAGWADRFVGNDPIAQYFFHEWFVIPAVTRAHAELSGDLDRARAR